MSHHIIPGNPPLHVALRNSTRSKRISLRVSRLDGKVTLTVPRGVSTREAVAFAVEKQAWLRDQLSQQPEQIQVAHGAQVPVAGRERVVVAGQGRSVVLGSEEIAVPGAEAQVGARLQGYLRELARNRLAEAVGHYGSRLGVQSTRLTLRDTRSRWGSCSSAGALMFSWRLVMAPSEVLDYVAAHEVAHLKEMNHSKDFWDLVADIYGEYEGPRGWLRRHGQSLHRYRFT